MSERPKVDPIDEAAARELAAFWHNNWATMLDEPKVMYLRAANICRLAILRGMLERELTDRIARAGAAEMWQCAVKENTVGLPDAQRIYRAMLSAEIEQLTKESP